MPSHGIRHLPTLSGFTLDEPVSVWAAQLREVLHQDSDCYAQRLAETVATLAWRELLNQFHVQSSALVRAASGSFTLAATEALALGYLAPIEASTERPLCTFSPFFGPLEQFAPRVIQTASHTRSYEPCDYFIMYEEWIGSALYLEELFQQQVRTSRRQLFDFYGSLAALALKRCALTSRPFRPITFLHYPRRVCSAETSSSSPDDGDSPSFLSEDATRIDRKGKSSGQGTDSLQGRPSPFGHRSSSARWPSVGRHSGRRGPAFHAAGSRYSHPSSAFGHVGPAGDLGQRRGARTTAAVACEGSLAYHSWRACPTVQGKALSHGGCL
jgi:hypothetical protein